MHAQLIAAFLLPFTMVLTVLSAEVVVQVVKASTPGGALVQDMVQFLVGAALMLGVFAVNFAWVKTGGFGVFVIADL